MFEAGDSPDKRQQLQHEIDILNKIKCDHIARLVDADAQAGVLAMQLVDGRNVGKQVADEHRLPVALTVQVGIDICRALEAIHARGWIHKDVKPDNIVLERSRRAVLVDFGLAEEISDKLKRGGTPYYTAPEVFFPGNQADTKADIFSLSATLYRLLSGRPPHFQHCLDPRRYRGSMAELDVQTFRLAGAATECDLEDLRPEVPRQLGELIVRGLSTNPKHRPSSAADFRAELENIQVEFSEATKIERDLWVLQDVLLQLLRNVSFDVNYLNREAKHATTIRNELTRTLQRFPKLQELQKTRDACAGFTVARAAVPRTVKVIERIDALSKQIDAFLAAPVGTRVQDRVRRNELLKNLVARTLEGIRFACVDTIAVAHDWRTVLLQLGLLDERATSSLTP